MAFLRSYGDFSQMHLLVWESLMIARVYSWSRRGRKHTDMLSSKLMRNKRKSQSKRSEMQLRVDDFMASLPENDCRYAVYDFDFVTPENCQKSKIFFIAWSPSNSRIWAKMLYAASKDQFRREMDGVHYEIQATDASEMDLETLRERAH